MHKFFVYLFRHQVIFALFLIVLGWFVLQIREILVAVFLAYIIMSALLPIVEWLRKRGLPKVFAVLIPYVVIFCAIVLLIIPLVPFVTSQTSSLFNNLPKYVNQSAANLGFQVNPKQINSYFNGQLGTLGQNAFTVTTKVFGGFFSTLTVFIISFYWLMYHESFKKFIASFFALELRKEVLETSDKVNEKLGAWLRGEIFLMFFIGLMSWIALTLIGLPYAFPLALIAGILEIVPTLGPILSAVPAVVVAFTISPTMAIIVIGIYILIQALENNFLVPNIMQKAVGLNPVVVILSIAIGANLMGIAGALLATPFVSFLVVVLQDIEWKSKK